MGNLNGKILIDHGGYANLGDAAMLEGAVGKLCTSLPTSQFYVVDHKVVPTSIMNLPHVHAVSLTIPQPTLQRKRWLWRFDKTVGPSYRRVAMSLAGRGAASQRLEVVADSTTTTLGHFCSKFDSLHVVGGGNLTDTFISQMWNRSCLMHAFASQRKPVVLTGQQIGPFQSNWSRRLVMNALRRASFTGLREPTNSLAFCRAAGLDESRCQVLGDDSFGVRTAETIEIDQLLEVNGLERGEFLAVNFRVAPYADEHAAHSQWFADVAAGVSRALNVPTVFVPISLGESDSDLKTSRDLAKSCLPGLALLEGVAWTPSLAKGLLGAAKAAVGASYHFCTFALAEGTPTICVHDGDYYTQKARGIAGLWGDDRICVRMGAMPAEDAVQHVVATLTDSAFRVALQERGERLRTRWSAFFENEIADLHGCVRQSSGAA